MIMERKNILQYLSRIMCVVLMLSLAACGDDDDDDDNNDDDNDEMVDELVGTYVFSSATFAQATMIRVAPNPADPTALVVAPFAVGADAFDFVGGALLESAPCADSDNTTIEIRDGGTAFYVCAGEGVEEQWGTWVVNADRTEFTLDLLDPEVAVAINDFSFENGVISGPAQIPVPYDVSVDVGFPLPDASITALEDAGVTLGANPTNIQIITIDIEFMQVN